MRISAPRAPVYARGAMSITKKYAAFLSYRGESAQPIAEVYFQLKRTTTPEYFFFPEDAAPGPFPEQLKSALNDSDFFLLFVATTTEESYWQRQEFEHFCPLFGISKVVPVLMGDAVRLPTWADKNIPKNQHIVWPQPPTSANTLEVTQRLADLLRIDRHPLDDLPTKLEARYEKQIVDSYRSGAAPYELVKIGYPTHWPDVLWYPDDAAGPLPRLKRCASPLDVEFFGAPRDANARVSVDARVRAGSSPPLAFPEAGPQARVRSAAGLKVGVLVSGGIAPGINAVISGIVERHEAYEAAFANNGPKDRPELKIFGVEGGLIGLMKGASRRLASEEARRAVSEGGSILTTARADKMLEEDELANQTMLLEIAGQLHHGHYDILYVIGGEGSMRAAHALWTVYHSKYADETLSIIGVPKTMDNDILWVWQSFGFMSAVEKAREVIIQLHTEVRSNPRLAIVQLFGSSSGYVVSHAALGSNVCDLALIPEIDFTMVEVCTYLERVLRRRRRVGPPWGLVVMAETAIPKDFEKYLDYADVGLTGDEREALALFKAQGVRGQTPDDLRSAGLKIVSGVVQHHIREVMGVAPNHELTDWHGFRVLKNEPRHIVRSIPPSVTDVAFGIRLGTMAVDTAMAGYTDCMVSQWLTEYVAVPLKLVVLGRKLVPTDGIFWKTVISKTGQGQKDFPGLRK